MSHPAWSVLRSGWPFLLFVGGPAVAWVLGSLGASNESDQIRFAGTWLQLFGLVLVWLAIRGVRKTFGSESEFAAIRDWIKALVKSFQHKDAYVIVGSGGAVAGGGSAIAFGRVRGGTIERRIELIQDEIDALRLNIHAEDSRLQAAITALKQDLEARATQLESADDELRKGLKDLAVGEGVARHLESIGFWWVVMSTSATNIPDELAKYL